MTRAKYQKAWFAVSPKGRILKSACYASRRAVCFHIEGVFATGSDYCGITAQQFYLVPVKPKKKRGR